ncbi:transcriptional Coactivator p15-domain-containing protein [Lipomyces kononenkoae]|uniref:Transcriptional Coactivator p15-domain-containing protein n=1 Tax=Lipomyces kononenkoae TaxID=34357 RepID=A0ACC3SX70_LIPKO
MPPKRFSSTRNSSGHKSSKASNPYKRVKSDSNPDDVDDSGGQTLLTIDIGKRKRLIVRDFKGTPLVDIREFYSKTNEDGSEVWLPGRKGISLTVDVWETVVAHIGDIEDALKKFHDDNVNVEDEGGDEGLKQETEGDVKDGSQNVNSLEE